MVTRNVVLTETQDQLVQALVSSGRYQNASEPCGPACGCWSRRKPG